LKLIAHEPFQLGMITICVLFVVILFIAGALRQMTIPARDSKLAIRKGDFTMENIEKIKTDLTQGAVTLEHMREMKKLTNCAVTEIFNCCQSESSSSLTSALFQLFS
jgi:hypothetical protein